MLVFVYYGTITQMPRRFGTYKASTKIRVCPRTCIYIPDHVGFTQVCQTCGMLCDGPAFTYSCEDCRMEL